MARSTPNNVLIIHSSAITLTLLIAWIAVVVTVIAGLCASRLHRRFLKMKPRPSQPTSSPSRLSGNTATAGDANTEASAMPPLSPMPPSSPMPPADQNTTGSQPPVSKTWSRRKLSGSLSIKLPEGLTRIRTVKKEQKPEEETIWKKTIIMGERCKAPSEEDDEVVVYDEKGNRQKIFHPKTPRSLPASRTNSFAEINFRSSADISSFL